MENLSPNLIKATYDLIRLYNTNSRFKQAFDQTIERRPNVPYRGRPLRTYVWVITKISPQSPQYKEYYRRSKSDPEAIKEIFTTFWEKQSDFRILEGIALSRLQPNIVITPQEAAALAAADKLPGKQKETAHIAFLNQKDQEIEKAQAGKVEQVVKNTGVRLPRIQTPSFIKDIALQAGIFIKKLLSRFGPNLFSGIVGSIVGYGTTQTVGGGVAGGFGGLLVPNFVKSGGGNLGGRVLDRIIPGGGGVRGGATNLAQQAATGTVKKALIANPWVMGTIGAVILILITLTGIGSNLLQNNALLPGGGLTQAQPLPGGGDASTCKFTRSDQKPPEATYQSRILLGYFQEASSLTDIPPTLLAAFMRVESPALTRFTDDQIGSYQCAQSPTGALGVMQLQPQGTTGHDAAAISNGARLINTDYNNLTREDYCNVRKSIIMGSGFILKKMSYFGYGDSTKWKPEWTNDRNAIYALVKGYYGCLLYGGSTDCSGPYNYGDDVWTGVQSCTTPVNPGGQDDFAINLVGKIRNSLLCNSGIVFFANVAGCTASIQPIPNLTAVEIVKSAISYTFLQCVGFVQSIVAGLTGQTLTGVAAAYEYIYYPPSGYKFISVTDLSTIVKVGDLAVWSQDLNVRPWGHVAYIAKVYDNTNFDVAEANWGIKGIVQLRKIRRDSEIGLAGWLRKQ